MLSHFWKRSEFRTITRVDLNESDQAALAAGHGDGSDPVFTNQLPIVVGNFKKAAAEEIMRWAHKQDNGMSIGRSGVPLRQKFFDDVERFDQQNFGGSIVNKFSSAGVFRLPLARALHTDAGRRIYIARLGALPIYTIRKNDILSRSPKEQAEINKLIEASLNPDRTDKAQEELVAKGIMKELPLGAIALMAGSFSRNGTLHCSSPVRSPTASASFFALCS